MVVAFGFFFSFNDCEVHSHRAHRCSKITNRLEFEDQVVLSFIVISSIRNDHHGEYELLAIEFHTETYFPNQYAKQETVPAFASPF